MDDEIRILKSLCKFYPSQRINEFQYKVMDDLGIKPKKKKKDGVEVLIKEYLWRKYKMGGSAARVVIKFLGKKFKEKDLKLALGKE